VDVCAVQDPVLLVAKQPKAVGLGRSAYLKMTDKYVGESDREQRHIPGTGHVAGHCNADAVFGIGHERRGPAGYVPADGRGREEPPL
jgi:hypothetical protein